MQLRSVSLAALTALGLGVLVAGAGAETLYFKNKRTIQVSSYQIKGSLIYVTMTNGKTVYLRADSVDWEGTKQLKDPAMTLQKTDYDSIDEAGPDGVAGGPAERLTAADLRKAGSGFKLRRANAGSVVVEIPANQAWIDTRVTLHAGQTLSIHVTGTVTVAPGIDVGPQGSASQSTSWSSLAPDKPFGSLLARIGLGSEPLAVGATARLVAPTTGRLYLTVNDKKLEDNSGAFSVRIELPSGSTVSGVAGGHGHAEAMSPGTPAASGVPAHPQAQGFVGGIDKAKATRDAAQTPREP